VVSGNLGVDGQNRLGYDEKFGCKEFKDIFVVVY
jgi:hypothetical protein